MTYHLSRIYGSLGAQERKSPAAASAAAAAANSVHMPVQGGLELGFKGLGFRV